MSNLHGYSVRNFMAQLPRVLDEDKRMNALAYAIAKALAVHLGDLPPEEIYTRIDELPEALLDILAKDFSIDWYDYDLTIEAKRELIKSNYYVHRHLGTKGAVESAISAIYPGTEVEEWFDYGGDPGYFRLFVNITDTDEDHPMVAMSPEEMERRLATASRWSAHLESFSYMIRHVLIIGAKIARWTHHPPICGTIYCGTWWEPSTLGYSERDTILAGAGPEAFPVSPEFAGTLPQNAVAAYTVCGGMVSGGAAAAYPVASAPASEAQACGTLPEEA